MAIQRTVTLAKHSLIILLGWVAVVFGSAGYADVPEPREIEWVTVDAEANVKVHFYFFWSAACPHCQRAKPFIESLAGVYPWLEIHSLPLAADYPENVAIYIEMARAIGADARSVPAFLFCGMMVTGYGDASSTGAFLKERLEECYHRFAQQRHPEVSAGQGPSSEPPVSIPFLGEIDVHALSLPALTLVLAGLDSFNPCAFFVLLFLLSLLVHARSRKRMLIIGGTFVFFSGLVYFLFMAAWLNLFLVIGHVKWITLVAGLVALFVAVVNIKDFFWLNRGISLSIPASAKPHLYERMRVLATAGRLPAMIFGTVALAIAANSYELLCTVGFPMVFTRALTLSELSTSTYYLYLVFYNLIYVMPLSLIVGVFVFTLGARKLTEREGRILKLLSGLMMLGLGLVLVFAPQALGNAVTAAVLLVIALVATLVIVKKGRVYLDQ